MGGWFLKHCPSLPIAVAHTSFASVAVLGHAVDTKGNYIDSAQLAVLANQAVDVEDLASELEYAAGRFGVIISGPNVSRLYVDPGGAFGAVYNPSQTCVGSTLFTAITDPVEPDRTYPLADAASKGEARFAFGHTPDKRVRRLLCNHYLDLDTFEMVRHWPKAGDVFACDLTTDRIHETIDQFIERQKSVLNAFTRAISPCSLPISGGADSRILLALCTDILPQIDNFFVHRTNRYTSFDRNIASTIAKTVGIDLNIYDPVSDQALRKRPAYVSKIQRWHALAMGQTDGLSPIYAREVDVLEAPPRDGIVIRGNVTDLSKAVLWRRPGLRQFQQTRGTQNDHDLSLRLMMLGNVEPSERETLVRSVADWEATLPEAAHLRLQDFLSLEQFRSHGQGSLFYALNHNFFLTPSADRVMLKALITLPPPIRANFLVNDLILEKLMPEIVDIPYVRDEDNQLRVGRLSLKDWVSKSREGGETL